MTDNSIEWSDNTLFEAVSSRIDCGENEPDRLIPKYRKSTEKENSNRQQCDSIKSLSSVNEIHGSPKKRLCLREVEQSKNISTNNTHNSFYGLPVGVKTLIKKIKGIDELYDWQDECLKLPAVTNRKNLIYALPTSGGKTLVAEILILKEILRNKKNVVFVLPFVALVQEKVQSMAHFALELGFLVEEYASTKGHYPPQKRRKKNCIYICTIEKAVGLVNSLIEIKRFEEVKESFLYPCGNIVTSVRKSEVFGKLKIGMIVVDELHLIGEDGGRGATLEGLLTKIMYLSDDIHIIGMSATIGNLEEITQFLNADLYTGNFRPIEIKEYVKCENNKWSIKVKMREIITQKEKLNFPPSKDIDKWDPDRIGNLVADVIPNNSCLIFCPNRKNCENVALILIKVLPKTLLEHNKNEKMNLIVALNTEEGLCPILDKTIKFGIAYHHSGLTSEERLLLEDAFREGTLNVLCCTSTLATGVNLPAQRVILRSPYIGNQFLNLSRYKQMVGRAGRAGLGDIGESILICKSSDLVKVKELLTSRMDDVISTMHIEKDKGINNLILSAVLLSISTNRLELHQLTAKTLLRVQQKRLDVDVKKITDNAITELLKCGIMKIKNSQSSDENFCIPSQIAEDSENIRKIRNKKTVVLTNTIQLELCNLGRAAMKAPIDLDCAYTLYQDLKIAKKHLILMDDLHLLYLVTPYKILGQLKPNGAVYYDVVTDLTPVQMETARLLGINEATIKKLREGIVPKNIESRIIERFYITLMIYELWHSRQIHAIAEKYQVNRGTVQNLLMSVSSFAAAVVRFCQELEEFWAFKALLNKFSEKLSNCCPEELEALMELPSVKIGRAYQLHKAGYTTLQSIAKASPEELLEKIKYLNRKNIIKMITTANLLIMKKVEDLKDEVEEVLDGIDLNSSYIYLRSLE